jgi:hypothetical protein
VDQAGDQRVQAERVGARARARQAGQSVQAGAQPRQVRRDGLEVPLVHDAQVVDILRLLGRDFDDPAHLGILGHALQRLQQVGTDARENFLRRRPRALKRAQWLADSFHHRVEEVALVAKVPVHRSPRDAGLGRDVVQRRARDAARLEKALGGIEDAFARGERIGLGSACHGGVGPGIGPEHTF